MLRGDLNRVQRRALTCAISQETAEREKREDDLFRQMMLAAHPQNARQIARLFDTAEHEMQQRSIEQHIPKGHDEIQLALEEVKRFGISLRDDGG